MVPRAASGLPRVEPSGRCAAAQRNKPHPNTAARALRTSRNTRLAHPLGKMVSRPDAPVLHQCWRSGVRRASCVRRHARERSAATKGRLFRSLGATVVTAGGGVMGIVVLMGYAFEFLSCGILVKPQMPQCTRINFAAYLA